MPEWIRNAMNRLCQDLYDQNETPSKYFGKKKENEKNENNKKSG